MSQPRRYKPFREDLPLVLHTWLFFIGTFAGFVFISIGVGIGIFWGVAVSAIISFLSHLAWTSSVRAFVMKRFFTKTLTGFFLDIFRKRSFLAAAKEMVVVDEEAEADLMSEIQRTSHWLVLVPFLLLVLTYLVDLLVKPSLAYFIAAETYYIMVGVIWMILCRNGRLTMLPLPSSDS